MSIPSYKLLTKYAISIGLLVFLFLHMDLSVLLEQSSKFNIWLVALSMVLVICQILFLNLRWHHLMNASRQNISFMTSSLINIAGYFANVFFITSIGGIVAKSALAVRHGLSITESVFATFLDRFMTLSALLFFAALGLPFLRGVIDDTMVIFLALLITGVLVSVTFALWALRSGMLKDFILSKRKRAKIVAVLRNYTENYPMMAKTAFYSIAAQGAFILSVFALSLGVDHGHDPSQTVKFLALMPVLMLVSSLPISFGGWGVREGAFILGLSLVGFPMESAFFLSVQVGLVTLIAPFIVGLPIFLRTDMKSFFVKGNKSTTYI